MASEITERWRRCSSCKKDIGFAQVYWVCSVSTCNRKRTGTVFCTVSCWEAHVPIMRHRESWAVEKTAPTRETFRREQADADRRGNRGSGPRTAQSPSSAPAREPKRTLVRRTADATNQKSSSSPGGAQVDVPREVLVVASRLKDYIRAVSGMNTSEAVLEVLSDHVRALCDGAIRSAREHERKTVMDRDYPKP